MAPMLVTPRSSQPDSPVARVDNAGIQYPSFLPPTIEVAQVVYLSGSDQPNAEEDEKIDDKDDVSGCHGELKSWIRRNLAKVIKLCNEPQMRANEGSPILPGTLQILSPARTVLRMKTTKCRPDCRSLPAYNMFHEVPLFPAQRSSFRSLCSGRPFAAVASRQSTGFRQSRGIPA